MTPLEPLRDRLQLRFPDAAITLLANPSPSGQSSLLLDAQHTREIARFLRDDEGYDYCSNVTGVDWPEKEIVETTRTAVPDAAGGVQKFIEEKTTRRRPGCLEVVYHLYSIAKKTGLLVIRVRTTNRADQVSVPSLTPIWRSCEFQEREVFDLFGVHFEGHPDLRRILMWDEFVGHPMRKDYVEPDDYEWEPTPHAQVLAKAKAHYPAPAAKVEGVKS